MAKPVAVVGHWDRLIQDLKVSTQDFYEAVQAAVEAHNIPGLKISRVKWKEGGLFSGSREYLRVSRKGMNFDICGAPFGNGFFLSWWLLEYEGMFSGLLKSTGLQADTFYSVDTANMFQTLVHDSVLDVLGALMEQGGLRALSEDAKKPQSRNVFV